MQTCQCSLAGSAACSRCPNSSKEQEEVVSYKYEYDENGKLQRMIVEKSISPYKPLTVITPDWFNNEFAAWLSSTARETNAKVSSA